MSRRQNQLFMPGTKIKVIALWGGPYRFPVFCSNQHEILQKCKGISFTDSDLNCRGWIKGLSLSLRLQPCWGAI